MPAKVNGLIAKLKEVHATLQALTAKLKRLDGVLGGTLKASMVTKTIADLVTKLLELLEVVHAALIALSNVPYVNVVAKPLEQVVGRIKDQVRPFENQLEQLENMIQPLRKQLQGLRVSMREIIKPVVQLDDFVTQELAQLRSTDTSTAALPNSRYKRAQQAQLEQLAEKLAGLLDAPKASLLKIQGSLDALDPVLTAITDSCEGLMQNMKLLTDLMGGLEDVQDDADSLDDALNQRISVGGKPVSVKQLLESAGNLPEGIMKQVTKLLAEPLRQLKQGMDLKLPDPVQVVSGFQAIHQHLDTIKNNMKETSSRLKDVSDKNYIPKAFGKIAA